MNETNHQTSEPSGPPNPPENSACGHGPTAGSGRGVFEPIVGAIRRGAADAKKAADQGAPKAKAFFSKAAYNVAYGISFATAYQFAAARIFCPELIKRGLREGLREGLAAGEQFARSFKSRKDGESAPTAQPVGEPIPEPPII